MIILFLNGWLEYGDNQITYLRAATEDPGWLGHKSYIAMNLRYATMGHLLVLCTSYQLHDYEATYESCGYLRHIWPETTTMQQKQTSTILVETKDQQICKRNATITLNLIDDASYRLILVQFAMMAM